MINFRRVFFCVVSLLMIYSIIYVLTPCVAVANTKQQQAQQRAQREQQQRQQQKQQAQQRAQREQQQRQQAQQRTQREQQQKEIEKQNKAKDKEKKNIQVQKNDDKNNKNVKSNIKPARPAGKTVTGHSASIPVSWGKANSTNPYQCTDYVRTVRPDLSNIHGNAATWLAKAKQSGFKTASGADGRPVKGAVVVMQSSDKSLMGTYGHVGVVKETGTDQKGGPYLIMESANYNTVNGVKPNSNQGTPPTQSKVYLTNQNIKGYIYEK